MYATNEVNILCCCCCWSSYVWSYCGFQILIQSVSETVVPKLVAEDIPLLQSLLSDVFPGVKYEGGHMKKLRAETRKVCAENNLIYGEGEEQGGAWVQKVSWVRQWISTMLVNMDANQIK